jgi:hypothetical protein
MREFLALDGRKGYAMSELPGSISYGARNTGTRMNFADHARAIGVWRA